MLFGSIAYDVVSSKGPWSATGRLLAAGIISEIKPPITDLTPYQNRRAVPIQGEPISETAIRERR